MAETTATPATATPREHAWQRGGPAPRDGYFALVLIATIVIVELQDGPAIDRLIAGALLVLLAPAYLVAGRRGLAGERPSRAGVWYVGVAAALFAASAALEQTSWFMQFALLPHIFMLLPVRAAVSVVVMMNLAPGLWLLSDQRPGTGVTLIAITAIVTTSSVAYGAWVDRIIAQSRERAELIEQLEATRTELATAHHRAGVLAERQRLSSEIHDTLAQGFTSILMLLQAAEPHAGEGARRPLELAERTARENLAEARALTAALAPPSLGSAPLAEAVRRLTERLGEEIDGTTSYETLGEPRTLPPAAEVVLLRTAQEALANVRKHAGARDVAVRVSYGDGVVRLEVCDDGAGFDESAVDSGPGGHWGLRGMRERVGQIGGTMIIDSSPGHGTTLTIEVPS
ncbi:sensor histidine kinase [Actinomadura alba]|uniref:Oxygen sensor histidine kinase NreB n=1 Tax=Actinomadura alba TaxID=406431 RepID=A0ABR7LM49_9ACTN|nr:sensor histidine kinase [Actinomadura alba]MBC6465904.1 sensor histidine kinase [Actinomadura alba]